MSMYKSGRRKGVIHSFIEGAEKGRRQGLALRSVLMGVIIVVLGLAILVCCFGAAIVAVGG